MKISQYAFVAILISLSVPHTTNAQLIKNTGLPISIANNLVVSNKMGGWVSDAGSTLANDGSIITSDDWINNGTYTSGKKGGFVLNYTSAKTFTLGGNSLARLKMNGSAGVTLSSMTVTDSLSLINGIISLPVNTDALTLTSNTVVTGGSATSYVDGTMIKNGAGDLTFPVGKTSNFLPVKLYGVSGTSPAVKVQLQNAPAFTAGAGVGALVSFPYAWNITTSSLQDTASFVEVQYSTTLTSATNPVVTIGRASTNKFVSAGAQSISTANGRTTVKSLTPYLHGLFSVATGLAGTVVLPASSINATGFVANWSAVAGATSYQMDISTDNFNTFIAGYNGKTVSSTSEIVTGLSPVTTYQYRVRAASSGGVSVNSATVNVTTIKQDQSITFNLLTAKTYGDASFNLSATSSSGLNVSFISSDSTIAKIVGNTVSILKVGTVTITAKQSGNSIFNAAPDVVRTLTVNKANQTITFAAIADKILGDPSFSLTATSSSSLSVTYSTTSDKITMSGSTVTLVKAGRVTVTASQAGNSSFNSATSVDQSFCIKPPKPAITMSGANTETITLTSSNTTGNQWFLNGTAIPNAANATLSVTQPGVYKVQTTADDCSSAFSDNSTLIVTGEIYDPFESVKLYPNPAHNYVQVTGIKEINESMMSDAMGRTFPIELKKDGDTYRGDVHSLPSGLYVLQIRQGNSWHQIKLLKN